MSSHHLCRTILHSFSVLPIIMESLIQVLYSDSKESNLKWNEQIESQYILLNIPSSLDAHLRQRRFSWWRIDVINGGRNAFVEELMTQATHDESWGGWGVWEWAEKCFGTFVSSFFSHRNVLQTDHSHMSISLMKLYEYKVLLMVSLNFHCLMVLLYFISFMSPVNHLMMCYNEL